MTSENNSTSTMEERKGRSGNWPISNDELRDWFSRGNIHVEELAEIWIHMDQNESTKAEIRQLVADGDYKQLEARLRTRIQFGTAGCHFKTNILIVSIC